MKILMTGHTKGLGKIIHDYFTSNGHEVKGISRSNGYDLKKQETVGHIIATADNFDLFINNTYQFERQLELVKALQNKISIVSVGSIASLFSKNVEWNIYGKYKKELEDYHRKASSAGNKNILLINITESTIENNSQSIISTIEHWLENPNITLVEFNNVSM